MAFSPTLCYQDGFQTTLSGSLTSSETAIPLTLLPDGVEGTLVIEPGTDSEEEIFYTSKGTGVVNCPSASTGRGVNSTAVAHNSGAIVKMLITKTSFEAIQYKGALIKNGGWDRITETITCGADNTLTASAGLVSTLSILDKIYLKDDGVDWYGWVVNKPSTTSIIVYGGTVSGTTGTLATIANGSTITIPQYSKQATPTGFPDVSGSFSSIGVNLAELASNFTVLKSASSTNYLITGLSLPLYVPLGKRIKITGYSPDVACGTSAGVGLAIWDGTVGSGTQLRTCTLYGSVEFPMIIEGIFSLSAGAHTINLAAFEIGNFNNGTLNNSSIKKSFISAEIV